jgi:hypothetical protein
LRPPLHGLGELSHIKECERQTLRSVEAAVYPPPGRSSAALATLIICPPEVTTHNLFVVGVESGGTLRHECICTTLTRLRWPHKYARKNQRWDGRNGAGGGGVGETGECGGGTRWSVHGRHGAPRPTHSEWLLGLAMSVRAECPAQVAEGGANFHCPFARAEASACWVLRG